MTNQPSLPKGRAWLSLSAIHRFAPSSYTFSTQSDPMHYVRMGEAQAEFMLNFLGVEWRKVVDENTRSNFRDWYGRPCSTPVYRAHYEAKISVRITPKQLQAALLAAHEAYYESEFPGKADTFMPSEHEQHCLLRSCYNVLQVPMFTLTQ